ncbi:MAG: NADP-dependent isocitrate dehydrogenase, partial [Salibacteraceae bacterium]
MANNPRVIYTKTDEAPALATASFLPIIQHFIKSIGIDVELKDISLAGRILSQFNDNLTEDQQTQDALAELGALVKTPEANIIKLPNISASMPQMKAAINELQKLGYSIPDYPDEPKNEKEEDIKSRYDRAKGSAVNPVLREGNSDRRAPKAVKEYAKQNPHRMGAWSSESKSHVASMSHGDFYESEKSITIPNETLVDIIFESASGKKNNLKSGLKLLKGEVIDTAVMSRSALQAFLAEEIADSKEKDVLFSVHLKATMMKVSDPILFGHTVKMYYKPVFDKFQNTFSELGISPNNGLKALLAEVNKLPETQKSEIINQINACYENGPDLAMVDSDQGITNLHVPSDVIIDASMPAMIRNSGQMWDKNGASKDTKAVIPDRSYAGVYDESIRFCKENGAFDPTTMGSVSNVGLMAQKAEEYGSHDKTFELPESGIVKVVDQSGDTLMEQKVKDGDIFRMCQVKDAPIQDWVKLAVNRAKSTGNPTIFWLDEKRAHDSELIKKVNTYLQHHDIEGLDIQIMDPRKATRFSMERAKAGKDTISVTGNVLRDYLTDLFPILEVGTSAKMLSIVPLMNGGGLFETGAGGSAPKHVQQLVEENHLRWDSLGEFLALAVSLEHVGNKYNNEKALVMAETLDEATSKLLLTNKAPSRKVGELDNRGSHYYLALYWAEALVTQQKDEDLASGFNSLHNELKAKEVQINKELIDAQGSAVDLGG